jgi:hypothetical protein
VDPFLELGLLPALFPCLCSSHLRPNDMVIKIFNHISRIDNKYGAAVYATSVLDQLFERYKFDPFTLLNIWVQLENVFPYASHPELKQILTYALSRSKERKLFVKFISLLSRLIGDGDLSPSLIQTLQELQIPCVG